VSTVVADDVQENLWVHEGAIEEGGGHPGPVTRPVPHYRQSSMGTRGLFAIRYNGDSQPSPPCSSLTVA
jgi:hypothetical protein